MFLWNYPQIPANLKIEKDPVLFTRTVPDLRLLLNYRTDQLLLFTGVENRSHKDDRTCFIIFNGIEKGPVEIEFKVVGRHAGRAHWPMRHGGGFGTGFVDQQGVLCLTLLI